MENTPLFTGFYTSQVVQDFFHQQYHHMHQDFIVDDHHLLGVVPKPAEKAMGPSRSNVFSSVGCITTLECMGIIKGQLGVPLTVYPWYRDFP